MHAAMCPGGRASTNTAEGFFGDTKRSLDGTHHQVSAKHLPLYLAELDYKYNTREETDGARTSWHPEDRRQATDASSAQQVGS